MSYYMGDFYGNGGYYRGDPFWGALLSGATKIFGKITGVGQKILAKGGGIFPGGNIPSSPGQLHAPQLPGPARMGGVTKGVIRAIIKHPVLSAAGAAGALATAGGTGAILAHHAGRAGHAGRRRRMNACNPRALRRAIRRAHAFEKLAKKVIGFSSPRKPKGHMYFKRRRKK